MKTQRLGFESSADSTNTVVGTKSPLSADKLGSPQMPVVSSALGLVTNELYDLSEGGAIEVSETMGPRRSARLAQKPPIRYTQGIHGLHELNPFREELLTSTDPSRPLQQRVSPPDGDTHATYLENNAIYIGN